MRRVDGKWGSVPESMRCTCGQDAPVSAGRFYEFRDKASCEGWYAVAVCSCHRRAEWAWPGGPWLLWLGREHFGGKEAVSLWRGRARSWPESWGRPSSEAGRTIFPDAGAERVLGLRVVP
jgi:hypothetical protein